jgi:hypothetical protein
VEGGDTRPDRWTLHNSEFKVSDGIAVLEIDNPSVTSPELSIRAAIPEHNYMGTARVS